MSPLAIPFTKMHALGNDFVIINALHNVYDMTAWPITRWAHRYFGIGFDQLLMIHPASQADFSCTIFNADGSEATQCVNGLRCVAHYLYSENIHPYPQVKLATKSGIFTACMQDHPYIKLTITRPQLIEPKLIFTDTNKEHSLFCTVVFVGNLHAIISVDDITCVESWQQCLTAQPQFVHGINSGFMQLIDRHSIRLRTFERGSGETYACGSNAGAAALAGIHHNWLDTPVQVHLPHGVIHVTYEKKTADLTIASPTTRIFCGTIEPEYTIMKSKTS